MGRILRVRRAPFATLCALLLTGLPGQPDQPASPDPAALAAAITDARDDIQAKAIAETLNLFLAQPIVPRKRVGLVIEVRHAISAERIFSSGPLAIGTQPVPLEVLAALRKAMRDDNPRVGLEALYAFGVLAMQPSGGARHDLLRECGADLAAFVGVADPAMRYASLRVIGRVYGRRREDPPLDMTVSDAAVGALNDPDQAVRLAAMDALGSLRDERAVQGLTQLADYYGRSREGDAALDAIARIAHPGSAAMLAAALASKSAVQRIIAIEGLARLGDASTLGAIHDAVGPAPAGSAAVASAFADAMLSNGPIDVLVDALVRPKVRDQAQQYLVELAGRRPSALEAIQHPDARTRPEIADVTALAKLRER